MEKRQYRQNAKRELEALAERAESVGDVNRAESLRRMVARIHDVDSTPEDSRPTEVAGPS